MDGFYLNGDVALGFRRLSIIDLSEVANQPMSNEDGTVTIVYNGEIYNFQSLREELSKAGHVFASQTDTEGIKAIIAAERIHKQISRKKMRGIQKIGERSVRIFSPRARGVLQIKAPFFFSCDHS